MQEGNKILADSISQADSVYYFTEVDEPAYLDVALKKKARTSDNCFLSIYRYVNSKADELVEKTYEGMAFIEGPLVHRMLTSFIIEKDGSISNLKIHSISCDGMKPDEEQYRNIKNASIRVLKELPRFTPAKHKGQVVRVRLYLPIRAKRL